MAETQGPPPLQSKLSAAQVKVEAGEYRSALTDIRDAKALEPRNIYVLAFEKQVEQLAEMADHHLLTDDQRGDILESLPGIIERALEGSSTAPGAPPPTDTRVEINKEREERNAALEWLKNQYFQHAHEYVRKGEYQHALAEIRRVYIIDPHNKIAKDFEQQIDQLITLRREQTTIRQAMPAASAAGPDTKPVLDAGAVPAAKTSAPAASLEAPEKKSINWTLVAAIILTLIAIAIAGFYFLKREKLNRPPTPSEQSLGEAVGAGEHVAAEQMYTIAQMDGGGTVRTSAVSENPAASTLPVSQPDAFIPDRGGGEGPDPAAESPAPTPSTPPDAAPPQAQDSPEKRIEEIRIIRLEQPQLPEGIYASGLEGQVVVRVDIDAEGNPRQTRIIRSTNDLLDHAVIDAVNRSEFAPRRSASGPVSGSITIPFTFRARR